MLVMTFSRSVFSLNYVHVTKKVEILDALRTLNDLSQILNKILNFAGACKPFLENTQKHK